MNPDLSAEKPLFATTVMAFKTDESGYVTSILTPALECFKCLFGNPLFSDYMDFIPRREYADEERTECLYNEIMTGDRVWTLQVSILAGEGIHCQLRQSCACI